MRIYRVHGYTDTDGSTGYAFFTSKAEAKRDLREHLAGCGPGEVDDPERLLDWADIQLTKAGVLSTLRRWASHPNNG